MTNQSVTDALATLIRAAHYYDNAPLNGEAKAALACVEDEIARLEERANFADAYAYRQRAEAAEAEVARLNEDIAGFRNMGISQSESIVALQAEVARLKDGLREIGRQKPDGTAARAVQIACALLAEDGAACGHEVWKHGVCELCGAKVDK